MTKPTPYPTRLLALSLCAALPLAAQTSGESTDTLELAPFKVTASGALSVLQITQRDLEQRQASDLEDTLSLDPSITVGGSTGVAQKIYVRNLGEGLINVSVDGATQAGSLFHHTGRIAIEPDLLKQVEVQPGTGNASDGPGALGGAIRFVTKDADDLLAPGRRAGALLKYGYFSNSRGHKGSATGFARLNDDWSALVSIVRSEHDDMEDGDGNRLTGSDSRQQVVLGKLTGQFGRGHSLRVSFENLDEEGTKLRRPEWAPGPANPEFHMETGRRTATLGYGFQPDTTGPLDLRATFNYSEADILQIGPWGPYMGTVESRQLDLRNTHRTGRHELVYGLDHRADEVAAGPDTDPDSVSEDSTVTGVFVQDNLALAEQVSLSLGARYDRYRLDDLAGQDFDDDGFSPNAGLTWRVTPKFSVTASAATAFRGAQIADAFRVDIHENDPALKAEKARNYELRFLYQAAGVTFEAGAYTNRIEDVVTNTVPWGRFYTNAGDLETDGLFARVSHATDKTYLSLQYNQADTTLDGRVATRYQYGSLVSRIGDTWVADFSWRPFRGFDLGWNTRLVQGVDNIVVPEIITGIPGGTIDKPGYVTHDLHARWTPAALPGVTFTLTVKNAFDKLYRNHGSLEDMTAFPDFDGVVGAYEPGRDIRLSASLRF
jgi:hemoglobin/transferrin/lactoferrin receptor protein